MRHWNLRGGLLGCIVSMMCVCVWALMGCGSDNDEVVIGGVVGLAAVDGAALAGLSFDFPDATIFGFPGESATLEVGENATTFTLTTSGSTVIHGTITPGASAAVSCQLTQNLQEVGAGKKQFAEEYSTCQAAITSQDAITFGEAGAGTVTLNLSRTGETAVVSGPKNVILHLREDGTVTINNNATPI